MDGKILANTYSIDDVLTDGSLASHGLANSGWEWVELGDGPSHPNIAALYIFS